MVSGYDCLSTCIAYAENIMKNDIKDYQIYFSFGSRKVYLENGTLCTDSHVLMEEQIDKSIYNIERLMVDSINKESSLTDYIDICCNQQNIFMICLDTGLLTYRNIFVNNARNAHYVCVLKYSADEKKVYIYDGYVPNKENIPFEGWVDLEEVLVAWKSTGCRHFIWKKPHIKLNDVENIIHNSVKETIYDYLDSSEKKDTIYGEKAVYEKINLTSLEDDMDLLIHDLKVKGFLTIKYYLLSYFENNIMIKVWLEPYRKIIERWESLCILVFFMKLKRRSNAFDEFKKQAMELLADEREILHNIYGSL